MSKLMSKWKKIKIKYNNSRIAKELNEFQIPTDLGKFIVLAVVLSVFLSLLLGVLSLLATPGGACLGIILAIVLFLKMEKKGF